MHPQVDGRHPPRHNLLRFFSSPVFVRLTPRGHRPRRRLGIRLVLRSYHYWIDHRFSCGRTNPPIAVRFSNARLPIPVSDLLTLYLASRSPVAARWATHHAASAIFRRCTTAALASPLRAHHLLCTSPSQGRISPSTPPNSAAASLHNFAKNLAPTLASATLLHPLFDHRTVISRSEYMESAVFKCV